jgi:hypothetical protein
MPFLLITLSEKSRAVRTLRIQAGVDVMVTSFGNFLLFWAKKFAIFFYNKIIFMFLA